MQHLHDQWAVPLNFQLRVEILLDSYQNASAMVLFQSHGALEKSGPLEGFEH